MGVSRTTAVTHLQNSRTHLRRNGREFRLSRKGKGKKRRDEPRASRRPGRSERREYAVRIRPFLVKKIDREMGSQKTGRAFHERVEINSLETKEQERNKQRRGKSMTIEIDVSTESKKDSKRSIEEKDIAVPTEIVRIHTRKRVKVTARSRGGQSSLQGASERKRHVDWQITARIQLNADRFRKKAVSTVCQDHDPRDANKAAVVQWTAETASTDLRAPRRHSRNCREADEHPLAKKKKKNKPGVGLLRKLRNLPDRKSLLPGRLPGCEAIR